MQLYDVSFEIIRVFMQDLLALSNSTPIVFELFMNQLKTDFTLYETKLALLQRMLPLMMSQQAT